MLEKNKKKLFDSHFHYADCWKIDKNLNIDWNCCSCAHSSEEWNIQKTAPECVRKCYGIHPQRCVESKLDIKSECDFIEKLLENHEICAIGEAGFDFFTDDFKARKELQIEMFENQLELAIAYRVPVVIHGRKANEKLFEYSAEFKKLPAVLFHSFMGPAREAESLAGRGINCFFSFGKQLMNGNKKAMECAENLPLENLLLETDAPFQTLKGENDTKPEEIERVYKAFIFLRKNPGFSGKIDKKMIEAVEIEEAFEITQQLEKNFLKFFH